MHSQCPDIFLSYARADSHFVLKLAEDLKSKGVAIWLDQLDIPAGTHWDQAVEEALKSSKRLLLVLSPESVTSQNVMDEVAFAIDQNKVVVPLLHRDCNIPFRLKRLQFIDFREDYDGSIFKLLNVLETNIKNAEIGTKNSSASTFNLVSKRNKRNLAGAAIALFGIFFVWNLLPNSITDRLLSSIEEPYPPTTVKVALAVDIYDTPGGGGKKIGMLNSNTFVTLVEPCRADNWCHVRNDTLPGGIAWIYNGPDYQSLKF